MSVYNSSSSSLQFDGIETRDTHIYISRFTAAYETLACHSRQFVPKSADEEYSYEDIRPSENNSSQALG